MKKAKDTKLYLQQTHPMLPDDNEKKGIEVEGGGR
jgi:hypothetical protein